MEKEFKNLYLLNDTDLLYNYLININYNKLDYNENINLFILYYNIYIQYYYKYDIESLLDILKNKSNILYYYYLSKITLRSKYYLNLIQNLKSNNILETMIILEINFIHYDKDVKSYSNKIDNILTKNNDFYDILNLYKDNIIKLEYPNYYNDDYYITPQYNNIIYNLKMYYKYNNINKFNKLKKFYKKIVKSNVNKNFIKFIRYIYKILTNNNKLILPDKIIESLDKLYDRYTTKLELKEYYFYTKIRTLLVLNKYKNNNYIHIYRDFYVSYIKTNINNINSLYNDETNNYIIPIVLLYLSLSNDFINFNNIIADFENINLNEKNINDILMYYYIIGQNNNILKLYNIHKHKISNQVNNIYTFDIIVNSMIQTGNYEYFIDISNKINDICRKFKGSYKTLLKNELDKLGNVLEKMIKIESVNDIFKLNYINDTIKENNDCMICLENIYNTDCAKCNKCNKYVGHTFCIKKYIIKSIKSKCVNCRL